jgi:alkyl hydroperoxide reductase subunit AhpC
MIKVGQLAPDFTLTGYIKGEFKNFTLSEVMQNGQWAVVFFYPLDFTFVCPTEITGFNKHHDEFAEANAQVMGISVDSQHSHRAWVEYELGTLEFPLLSDFQKQVSDDYDVLFEDPEDGKIALRGTFIIDPQGVLRYAVVSDKNVGRSVEETVRVVKALQTGGMCPVDWEEGEKTLDE